jgi:hypothetical protein
VGRYEGAKEKKMLELTEVPKCWHFKLQTLVNHPEESIQQVV